MEAISWRVADFSSSNEACSEALRANTWQEDAITLPGRAAPASALPAPHFFDGHGFGDLDHCSCIIRFFYFFCLLPRFVDTPLTASFSLLPGLNLTALEALIRIVFPVRGCRPLRKPGGQDYNGY